MAGLCCPPWFARFDAQEVLHGTQICKKKGANIVSQTVYIVACRRSLLEHTRGHGMPLAPGMLKQASTPAVLSYWGSCFDKVAQPDLLSSLFASLSAALKSSLKYSSLKLCWSVCCANAAARAAR